MTVRISELNELTADLSQSDLLPIVDLSGGETKKIQTGNLITIGISGAPSSFIDLSKLNQSSTTKLSFGALAPIGVASGTYGNASTVPRFTVNNQGLVSFASGVPIVIPATSVTGLAAVATSGTYASLTGLPALGTLSSQNANSVSISGGTVSGVVFITGNATISGGTIAGITDIAIADGGTGASTASGARANLGLVIGINVQAYSPILSGVANQFTASDQVIYASASGVVASTSFTSFGRSLVSGSTASGVRSTLGLGTIATQNANSIAITGGTISGVTLGASSVTISGGVITGITDLAIADGGTGASTASGARANLGLIIGTNVQAYSPILSSVANQFTAADEIIYASASGVAASTAFTSFARSIVSGSTASGVRSTLGLGTLATQDAASVAISGGTINGASVTTGNAVISGGTITGITDLAIADGGTGASNASDARANLGLTIGTNVQAYSAVLSGVAQQFNGADQVIYASASGVVASATFTSFARSIVSGSTASGVRSILELGTLATQNANSVVISGGTISGVTLGASNVNINGGTISGITDLAIADGGTGASSAVDARANLGLTIGTNVQAYSSSLQSLSTATTSSGQIVYTTASGQYTNSPITELGRSLLSESAASGVRNVIGLGTIATQSASSVVISGGTISGITDLAVADGGTGASTASGARANLGLAIGTDIQAYDPALASIAGLTTSTNQIIYTTASDTYATAPIVPYARVLLASGTDASNARAYLGLGSLSTLSIVPSGFIDNGVVVSGMIADGNITSVKIASGNIIASSIADSAIITSKINDDAVTAAKLANNSATIYNIGAPLADGAFTGQRYVDSITNFDYVWTGTAWQRSGAITSIAFTDNTPLSFAVSYPDGNSASITTSLDNQSSNRFFAGPASGSATAPTFRAIVSSDLPVATSGTIGAVLPGAGLSVSALGAIGHSNTALAGTYAGPVTIDAQGHIISAQTSLQASDIPSLDASKITTGTFDSSFLAPNSVTAAQLADYGIAQVSESAPVPEFAGQWWINPNDRSAYIWVGEVTPTPNGYWLNLGYGSATQVNLRFGGTYNASGNIVESINSYGIEAGLTVGQALSAPSTSNNGVYLIVTASGIGTNPAPNTQLSIGNWVLSQGVGANWTKINLSSAVAGVADQDVLVDGNTFNPVASGVASQEDLNEILWGRVQTATTITRGIVQASSEIIVASGTGTMNIGIIDDGSY